MAITKLKSSRDFFRIWFFWKKQAIFLFLFIVAIVMLYAYTTTPKYKSVAKVMLLPKSDQELVLTDGGDYKRVIQKVSQEDLNTEIDLLTSDKVIEKTIQSFNGEALALKNKEQGLFDKTFTFFKITIDKGLRFLKLKEDQLSEFDKKVAFLKKSIEIETDDSNILKLSLVAEQAEQAPIVLNRIIESYILHHNDVFSIKEGLEFYDDQTILYKQKLEKAEQDLESFYDTSRIINLEGQNAANIALFSELKKELQYIQIDYDEAQSRIDILEKSLKNKKALAITKEMRDIPAIIEFEKGIVPIIIRRAEISKSFTKTSREYRDINYQIEVLQNELRSEIMRALETDKLEAAALKAKINSLSDKITLIHEQAIEIKEKERTLQELQRQVTIHKDNYLVYASKTESSRLYSEKKDRNLANVSIVDRPSIPVHPFSPQKLLLLFISTFCSLIAALSFPFILETLDQKLKTADDIEILLDLPVISTFSKIK